MNGECSDLNGPHQRLREGCERLGYDFRLITRNADRDRYDPESAAYMGFGDAVGLEALDREDLPGRRPGDGAEIFVGAAADAGSWSRTAAPPGSRRSGADPAARPRTAPAPSG